MIYKIESDLLRIARAGRLLSPTIDALVSTNLQATTAREHIDLALQWLEEKRQEIWSLKLGSIDLFGEPYTAEEQYKRAAENLNAQLEIKMLGRCVIDYSGPAEDSYP